MSDEEVLIRKGRLMDEFVAAQQRVELLQAEAHKEAAVLEGIVEFLKSGGLRGRISGGASLEEYLSAKVAKLVNDLNDSMQKKKELRDRLSSMGIQIAN